jgi:hypothetical protein
MLTASLPFPPPCATSTALHIPLWHSPPVHLPRALQVNVPSNRFTPLKENWLALYEPVTKQMKVHDKPFNLNLSALSSQPYTLRPAHSALRPTPYALSPAPWALSLER